MCSLRTDLTLAALTSMCGISSGGITYVTQSRGVNALAEPSGDSVIASDFSAFEAYRSVQSEYRTGASASQVSTLGGEGMFMEGLCSSHGGMQLFRANASSWFDVTFTLDEDRPFRFWGGVALYEYEASAQCQISLMGPTGLVYEQAATGNWDLSGTAQAGQYRLLIRVESSTSAGLVSASGRCYGGFVVPSPGTTGILAGIGAWSLRRRR